MFVAGAAHVGDVDRDADVGLVARSWSDCRASRRAARTPIEFAAKPLASGVPTVSVPELLRRRRARRVVRAAGRACGSGAVHCVVGRAPARRGTASRPSAADRRATRWRGGPSCRRRPCRGPRSSGLAAEVGDQLGSRLGRPPTVAVEVARRPCRRSGARSGWSSAMIRYLSRCAAEPVVAGRGPGQRRRR